MSDYFDRVEGHLLDAVERRARRSRGATGAVRRRLDAVGSRLRGRPGLLAIGAVLVLSGSAAGAVLLSQQRSRPLSGVVPAYRVKADTISVAGAHYEIIISPSLSPGTIGWCETIVYEHVRGLGSRSDPSGAFGGGTCPSGTPAVGSPLFAASGGREAGLWFVLAAPQVASVRVAHGPTVETRGEARLPYGYRAAVFELGKKAFPRGRPPQLTALDANGQPIRGGAYDDQPPQETVRYWTGQRAPSRSACSIGVRPGSGARIVRGGVVTRLFRDPGIIGHAFLACVAVDVALRNEEYGATLLLDAKHPSLPPAALPGLRAVVGRPGTYSTFKAHAQSIDELASVDYVARRVGDAWLLVTGRHAGEAADLRVLRALTTGPLHLRTPRRDSSAQRDAECRIGLRATAGAQEVSQKAFLVSAKANASAKTHAKGLARSTRSRAAKGYAMPTSSRAVKGLAIPKPSRAELIDCASASFYVHAWPLTATVMYSTGPRGVPPELRSMKPVPRHPGEATIVPIEGEARPATVERVGKAWVEVSGGRGLRQQRALLSRLIVKVSRSRPLQDHDFGNSIQAAMLPIP